MDYHIVAGGVGVLFELASMALYFRDIFRHKTKPHVFTWLGWGLVNAVVGGAQFVSGAGPGVWVTAVVALMCFTTAGLALVYGEKNITKGDWACLLGSVGAMALWTLTSDPLLAVVVVTVADLLAFIPTIRKAYRKPAEETVATFGLGAARNLFTLLALNSFAVVNWLYPATLFISDGGFAVLLVWRRKALKVRKQTF